MRRHTQAPSTLAVAWFAGLSLHSSLPPPRRATRADRAEEINRTAANVALRMRGKSSVMELGSRPALVLGFDALTRRRTHRPPSIADGGAMLWGLG
jgi:hypothetical protein